MHIREAVSDAELKSLYVVLHQLRPQYTSAEALLSVLLPAVRQEGLRVLACYDEGSVVAVLTFRVQTLLSRGRIAYVDDLVTAEHARSRGYGKALLDQLILLARQLDLVAIHLDSGVQRFDAHRFYLRERFAISCHHFSRSLGSAS